MSRVRYTTYILSLVVLAAMSLTFGGCKAQQQMQSQIADMDTRLTKTESHVTTLDGDVRKANMGIQELRGQLSRLTDATMALQKVIEEQRQKAADAEAAAKAKAGPAAKKAPAKKAPPAKAKKRH